MSAQQVHVGQGGAVILPDGMRQRFGLEEGSVLIAEERAEGILLRPADLVETYTPERKAEFLLGNATTPEEYTAAVAEVRRMGLDPEHVDHFRPAGSGFENALATALTVTAESVRRSHCPRA